MIPRDTPDHAVAQPRPAIEPPVEFAAKRYSFAAGEALKALGVSSIALRSALWRLARSRRVASPRRGFYVIVPPEHRAVGCPSPEWFIDDLMAYLGCPYYVGLLTAGALHGAAH